MKKRRDMRDDKEVQPWIRHVRRGRKEDSTAKKEE